MSTLSVLPFMSSPVCVKCRADVRASSSNVEAHDVLLFACGTCGFRFATDPADASPRRLGSREARTIEVPESEV